MFADENFRLAIWNTTVYSVAIVLISTVIALPLAVVLARRGKMSIIYQTIYFLPVITPVVPMAIAWKWIYDYNYGLLNYILSIVGIPPIAWLTDARIALWALIIMGVWKGLGYSLGDLPGRHPQHSRDLHRGGDARRSGRSAEILARDAAAAAPDHSVCARDRDHQRLQRVHPRLRHDARLAVGARAGGAGARL
jgi:hypothetical protein